MEPARDDNENDEMIDDYVPLLENDISIRGSAHRNELKDLVINDVDMASRDGIDSGDRDTEAHDSEFVEIDDIIQVGQQPNADGLATGSDITFCNQSQDYRAELSKRLITNLRIVITICLRNAPINITVCDL